MDVARLRVDQKRPDDAAEWFDLAAALRHRQNQTHIRGLWCDEVTTLEALESDPDEWERHLDRHGGDAAKAAYHLATLKLRRSPNEAPRPPIPRELLVAYEEQMKRTPSLHTSAPVSADTLAGYCIASGLMVMEP